MTQVITIVQTKGGSGKTTTATFLASAALDASAFRSLNAGIMVVGDPMTVYAQPNVQFNSLGDPCCVLPCAKVVGAYFAAPVTRAFNALRPGENLEDEKQSEMHSGLLFTGKVRQRCRLEGSAVAGRHHCKCAALAQNVDHFGPFHGISLRLIGATFRDGQAGLLTGLCQEHNRRSGFILWQCHYHRAIRSRPENSIGVANDPDGCFALREVQNGQATFCGGHPTVERQCRTTRDRNHRQSAKCGRQNMHRQGPLSDGLRQHHITTIICDRYVLLEALSTAFRRNFWRGPGHVR